MVANLPYSVATPLILRTIERAAVARELDGDGPARDRRPAAGGARQPHLRLPQRRSSSSPARSSCCARVDPAVFRPRPRVDSAILRLRRSGPGADEATARARPRRLRPPPQVPRPLARARPAGLARRRPARRWPSSGCPRTPGPRRCRPSSSPPCPRSCRPTPEPRSAAMLVHAPAKLNLCLYLGRAARTACTSSARCSSRWRWPTCSSVSEAERDEVLCPGVEGENLAAAALAALRERGWERGAAADRDREAGPGRRRPRRRQRRRRRGPPPRRRRGRRTCARIAAGLGADVPSQLRPGAGAGPRRRRAGRAAAGAGGARGRAAARRRRPRAPPRSSPRPTGSGSAASRRSSTSWRERLRAAAGAGASPLAYPELLVNDLEPAARSLRPGDRRRARRAARGRRRRWRSSAAPARPRSGSSPTSPRPAPRPRRSTATTRSSARPGRAP